MRDARTLIAVCIVCCLCSHCGESTSGPAAGNNNGWAEIDLWAVTESNESHPSTFQQVPENDELELNFGLVAVRATRYLFLYLHNSGQGNLKISRISWQQGASHDFSLSCRSQDSYTACPVGTGGWVEVEPGSDLVVRVAYSPQESEPDRGIFLVESNSVKHGQLAVRVSGEGAIPLRLCLSDCTGGQDETDCLQAQDICSDQVASEPLLLAFGDSELNATKRRRVIITNQLSEALRISDLFFETGEYNQFRIDKKGYPLPGVIEPGGWAEIDVVYSPTFGGEHRTVLRVLSIDMDSGGLAVNVSGRGLAPRLCTQPQVVDFGEVPEGESSTEFFTVANCGLKQLELKDLRLSAGTSEDFAFFEKPVLPRLLQPGESLEVKIQYDPSQAYSDVGGVDIFSNDPAAEPDTGYTGTVQLRGRACFCDIGINPVEVNFGGVVITTSASRELTLSNLGTCSCIFEKASIELNSPDHEFVILQEPPAGTRFDPGQTLSIKLEYTPRNLGMDTGSLTIWGNDKDGQNIVVSLRGQGLSEPVCDITVTPSSYQFGTIRIDENKKATVNVANSGQATCTISRLEIKQGPITPGDISLTSAPQTPFALDVDGAPGSKVDLEVTFAPTRAGTHKSYLIIETSDPDLQMGGLDCIYANGGSIPPGTACMPLSGTAGEAIISANPNRLDFGQITLGCASREQEITLSNYGTLPVRISRIFTDAPFSLTSVPNTPFEISSGGSAQVKVRYIPNAVQQDQGTLTIESDATNVTMLTVPLSGTGTAETERTDYLHQIDHVASDVLFVIDNSGSMSEEQNALINNFVHFIDYAIARNASFHIGVIATEVNNAESGLGNPPREIVPGILVQAPGRPKIITNTTTDIVNAFRDNATLGTCCSDEQEAGLQAAWMALSPPNIDDPAKNAGFLREDARLYIIILSDEQDQSQNEPAFYAEFFKSLKGKRNLELSKVSAIVGDEPNGCGNGQAESGSRYLEVAQLTGGMFVSICSNDWSQNLEALAADAFSEVFLREFTLSRFPVADTISVVVDGQLLPPSSESDCFTCNNGWVYYADTNTVCFCPASVPGPAAQISVHYSAACITP